jgi:cobalamin biosynthesis Mg chelatase CobN
VLAVLLAGALLLAGAGPAAAAPCWKTLLNDWYDGTIDRTYPIPCYNQAVDHLPVDVANYSSAREDILRALQSVVAAQNTTTGGATTGSSGGTTSQTTTGQTTTGTTTDTAPTTTSPGREEPKGIKRAIVKVTPGDADSFPLPLLILGGLAIVLVTAGIAGMIWRRSQGGDTGTT